VKSIIHDFQHAESCYISQTIKNRTVVTTECYGMKSHKLTLKFIRNVVNNNSFCKESTADSSDTDIEI